VEERWHRVDQIQLCILDGDSGLGKSTVLLDLGARVTAAGIMLDDTQGITGDVAILSAEDSEEDTIKPRLLAADADEAHVHIIGSMQDHSDATTQQLQLDLQYGVLTINEVRAGRGLPPVPWGDQPWLNSRWAQADQLRDRGAPPLPGQPTAQAREATK
jgi:hypothetical protein